MQILFRVIIITMLICFGIPETEEDTGSVKECKTPRYSEEGLPTWIRFPLPINPIEERSYVYVKKLALNSDKQGEIVLEGTWNNVENKVDFRPRMPGGSFEFGGLLDNNETLLLVINEMSPFHEGTYEVETNPLDASKTKSSFCNLTMTPAGKEPDTSPDVRDKKNTSCNCTPTVKHVVEKSSNSNQCSKTWTTESLTDLVLILSVAIVLALVVVVAQCVFIVCLVIKGRHLHCYQTRRDAEHDTVPREDTSTTSRNTKNPMKEEGANTMDNFTNPASSPMNTVNSREMPRGHLTGEIVNKTEDRKCGEIELPQLHQASGGATLSSNLASREAGQTVISMAGGRTEDEDQLPISLHSTTAAHGPAGEDDTQLEPDTVHQSSPDEEPSDPSSETAQLLEPGPSGGTGRRHNQGARPEMIPGSPVNESTH